MSSQSADPGSSPLPADDRPRRGRPPREEPTRDLHVQLRRSLADLLDQGAADRRVAKVQLLEEILSAHFSDDAQLAQPARTAVTPLAS